MARGWSRRARRDFDERREYRRERGEEDRYVKRGDSTRDDKRSPRELEEDAREDRREERGYREDEWSEDDFDNYLMQIRNASPDDNVDDAISRLRERYDYYERELDRYDADYDDLMAEVDRLRRDNRRYMMRESAKREGDALENQQRTDIIEDGEPKDFDDLWKNREG